MKNKIILKVKQIIISVFFIGSISLTSCVTQEEDDVISFSLEQEEEMIHKVPLADPFILVSNDRYLAYGTYNAGVGFNVFISYDLKTWEMYPEYILHRDNVIGNTWFWAPEVYESKGMYYLYYAAEEHLAVAYAKSPFGPFLQDRKTWLADRNSIDGCIFSENGTDYLYFVNREDGKGNRIFVAKLNDDHVSIDHNSYKICIGPSQKWELDNVNEGPTVVKVGNKYIMTYSGCGYGNPDYGIGVAVSDDPMGPWEKYTGNPVMQYPVYKGAILQGTGHNSLFKDLNGNWRMVFHAHSAKGIEGGRYMYIVTVDLLDHPPYIVFQNDLFAPIIDTNKDESE